ARAITHPVAAVRAPFTLVTRSTLQLGDAPLGSLIEGFRISPRFAPLVFTPGPHQTFSDQQFARDLFLGSVQDRSVLERVKAPEDITFFFSIVDSGTGREFQDQPAHNLASLGKSDGERPVPLPARPRFFLPPLAA